MYLIRLCVNFLFLNFYLKKIFVDFMSKTVRVMSDINVNKMRNGNDQAHFSVDLEQQGGNASDS